MNASPYLRNPEAAEYLRLSRTYLEQLRINGTGPRYTKIGRAVIYSVHDLDEWMASRRVRSTSEGTRLAG